MRATILLALVAIAVAQSTLPVSVVGDATYKVFGPICSGAGAIPAGNKCPIKGDEAIESCLPSLPSFANGKCVAPVDAVCQKIPSGAWGCVWPSGAKPGPPAVTTAFPRPTTLAPNSTNSTNATKTNGTRSNDTITAPPTTKKP
ncbi:Aste57867_12580 [Aphanomyces stellatus]|uniref:Aste57867_12580 protein n=1 Tax=Aphanomyces stellatus TaxID=120398 RepID=A0A485KVZ3_9STRA|nr:hypothetical protein As57867_012534 [Aphanomyces stellatus]VFT89431.1 Aste57867_12580 [Aphanomyces stellatus]